MQERNALLKQWVNSGLDAEACENALLKIDRANIDRKDEESAELTVRQMREEYKFSESFPKLQYFVQTYLTMSVAV